MIPFTLHTIWVGPPMPPHLQACVETWAVTNPQLEHRHWTETEIAQIDSPLSPLIVDAKTYAPRNVGQFVSDLVRLHILWTQGGVYVDCDMEALQSIQPLLRGKRMVMGREDHTWVSNALWASEKQHPALVNIMRNVPASIKNANVQRPNLMTGPQFITPYVQNRADVTIHEPGVFFPYHFKHLDASKQQPPEGAYTVHHWNNQRRGQAWKSRA